MIRSYHFPLGAWELRVAPLPAALALLLLALLVWAGFWQLGRAEQKRDILVAEAYRSGKPPLALGPELAGAAPDERLRYRRATARGIYRGERQYLLDNRTHGHVAGYHVLTPLRLQGGDLHVMVNRGWVPVGPDRSVLPEVGVDGGPADVRGTLAAPPSAGLELGPSGYGEGGWPRVVQKVDLAAIAAELRAPVFPLLLRLAPGDGEGFVREWRVSTGLTPERHTGYAVQWFALALALVILCAWVALVRRKRDGDG